MKKDYIISSIDRGTPQLEAGGIRVAQLGRRFCRPGSVINTHIHLNLFELTIVTEGRAVVTTNNVPLAVKAGDIYLSLPADAHKIESDEKKPLKYDFFAFTCRDPRLQQDMEGIATLCHGADARVFQDGRIAMLISNAIAELGQRQADSEALLDALFRQVMIYTVRGFQTVQSPKSTTATGADILCHKLMNYIDTHIYTLKKLEDLAPLTDYSYGYLSALFKKTTSGTLSDYYHEKKLNTARLLVLGGDHSITEIAEMLNYTSVYAFSKAFSNRYGMSPRNYRENG